MKMGKKKKDNGFKKTTVTDGIYDRMPVVIKALVEPVEYYRHVNEPPQNLYARLRVFDGEDTVDLEFIAGDMIPSRHTTEGAKKELARLCKMWSAFDDFFAETHLRLHQFINENQDGNRIAVRVKRLADEAREAARSQRTATQMCVTKTKPKTAKAKKKP